MITELPQFSTGRILVVGDVMLDKYWHGDTGRISPEAPVLVVKVKGDDLRPGGAANVAMNIAALQGQVTLVAMVGDDDAADVLEHTLSDAGVNCVLERQQSVPTITKLRLMSRHQQLIRIDFEEPFPQGATERLEAVGRRHLEGVDLVILSDYGKGSAGCFPALIREAGALGIPVLVDPKSSDLSRYQGATLLTPNLSEFEAVVGPCADDRQLIEKGMDLIGQYGLQALLITRGEQGMTLLRADAMPMHMPTQAREVFDVTGAGDTVIAVLGAAMAVGMELPQAAHLANMSAGLVVAKLGTATVATDELNRSLHDKHAEHKGIVDEETLVVLRAQARRRGETVVLTNGVFDILHAGHVNYLQQAARLGDRLIVAVNIDETVRALKGVDRPVNPVRNRMTMLAALECVDWVVAFSEMTPERLICRLAPDLLVKGGDNDPDRIPGADCTRKQGGEVRVMDYIDGISTTSIINGIRSQ